jgi:hypothetical protein
MRNGVQRQTINIATREYMKIVGNGHRLCMLKKGINEEKIKPKQVDNIELTSDHKR